jgi:hypothetical protein
MIRARFYANGNDYRPVKWPIKHPYWCSGSTFEDPMRSIIVAYADSIEEILELWPEAENIDAEEAEDYEFTDRFPKPEWFKND